MMGKYKKLRSRSRSFIIELCSFIYIVRWKEAVFISNFPISGNNHFAEFFFAQDHLE